jgi:hypothetical protein
MSGQNFYLRQLNGGTTAGNKTKSTSKPKRKLKKDYIAEVNKLLGKDIIGLDKCTIATLEQLIGAINDYTH